MKLLSPRLRFAAALALYLGWVAVLAVMASTSATRPATRAQAQSDTDAAQSPSP